MLYDCYVCILYRHLRLFCYRCRIIQIYSLGLAVFQNTLYMKRPLLRVHDYLFYTGDEKKA